MPPAKIFQSQIKKECKPETGQKLGADGCGLFQGSTAPCASPGGVGEEAPPSLMVLQQSSDSASVGSRPQPSFSVLCLALPGHCRLHAGCCGEFKEAGLCTCPQARSYHLPGARPPRWQSSSLNRYKDLLSGPRAQSPESLCLPYLQADLGFGGWESEPWFCLGPTEGLRVPPGTIRVLGGTHQGQLFQDLCWSNPGRLHRGGGTGLPRNHATGSVSKRTAQADGQKGVQGPSACALAWAPGPTAPWRPHRHRRGRSSLDAPCPPPKHPS